MGLYTYINENDYKNWSKVSHEELNELFQEARELDDSLLISERSWVEKSWFKKSCEVTAYTVFHNSPAADGSLYQARQMLGVGSSIQSVTTYLYGIINGALSVKRKNLNNN